MRLSRIDILRSVQSIAVGAILLSGTTGSAQHIVPPDGKGPYNVGFTTFCATVSGGRVTRIQVFYPTWDPPDHASTYPVYPPVNQSDPVGSCVPAGGGLYRLSSPLRAAQGANPVPEDRFPLIVHDHGGAAAGADFQRLSQLPVHEALASHGFVVVVALHSANALNRVLDVPLVIDVMLARNATAGDLLSGTIDPDRIGISGESTGGGTALRIAGGWSENGVTADPRIKAMAVYEPTPFLVADVRTIARPYLVMGGTQYTVGLAIPDLFDATVLAAPRIYVKNPRAVHISHQTGICSRIDEAREAALTADPAQAEPLDNLITLPSGLRACRPTLGAAAAAACSAWNMGEILFPTAVGFGGGRNFCTRVGVHSMRSLDVNPIDGLTDSPPFAPTDAFTLEVPVPGEVMVSSITFYTVAFWKKFLEGDGRYMRYLTPGYAKSHRLQTVVKMRD
jgi:hypothetical protein